MRLKHITEEHFTEMLKAVKHGRGKGSVRKQAMPSTDLPRAIASAPSLTTQSFFVATILPNLNDMLAAARSSKGKWQRYDEEKHLYQSLIKADIKAANIQPMSRVHVSFLWHEKNKRRDKDNICAAQKYIFDALVEQQILPNDGWSEIAGIHHAWVVWPQQPGCLVTLEAVAP